MIVCNYCTRPIGPEEKVVAGPNNVHICKPCVKTCLQVLEEREVLEKKEASNETDNSNGEV